MDNSVIITTICALALLLGSVVLDLRRNVRGYPERFIRIRTATWLLMGLSYAVLFMGRYHWSKLNQKDIFPTLNQNDISTIISYGLVAYAVSIIINGNLIDVIGAKIGMCLGTCGSGIMNIVIYYILKANFEHQVFILIVANMFNNFFQSFGSLSICKVGVYWYHQSERGFFGGIFGVVVGFGFFLAFNMIGFIYQQTDCNQPFLVAGLVMLIFFLLNLFFLKPKPTLYGFAAIEGTEETKRSPNESVSFLDAAKSIFSKPIFYFFIVIEMFVGMIRDGVLSFDNSWMDSFFAPSIVKVVHPEKQLADFLVTLGSMFGSLISGIISDVVFDSRRQPVALLGVISYLANVGLMLFANYIGNPWIAAISVGIATISFSSVHGIITSTCAMDFAGSAATGTAVGLLDGFQKAGSALGTSIMKGWVISKEFSHWMYFLAAAACIIIGLLLIILNQTASSSGKIIDNEEAPLIDDELNENIGSVLKDI
eukprot:TRINITY_DN3314_c4_g4_i1.p1 TRINITY_DN3314_c4_g4~~TRINITY_DN3314_c4_g4_i1.p1  ORF type:complete len:483 (+),score=124.80 TRINITY_DN3314_c4_g4_i1:45-1493(+)